MHKSEHRNRGIPKQTESTWKTASHTCVPNPIDQAHKCSHGEPEKHGDPKEDPANHEEMLAILGSKIALLPEIQKIHIEILCVRAIVFGLFTGPGRKPPPPPGFRGFWDRKNWGVES